MRSRTLLTLSLAAAALVAGQVPAQTVVGTLTATVTESGERTWYVTRSAEEAPSSWTETGDGVRVTLIGQPDDRTVDAEDGRIELSFLVRGNGANAEAEDVDIVYDLPGEDGTLVDDNLASTEVSLTSFDIEGETLALSGNFAGGLTTDPGDGEMLDGTAIEGDFQATIMPPPEASE